MNESDRDRRRILDVIATTSAQIRIYTTTDRSDQQARATVLPALLDDLSDLRAIHLGIEQRQPHDNAADRRLVAQRQPDYTYDHHPSTEPLIWISDAVAWCHGRGGLWRTELQRRELSPTVIER